MRPRAARLESVGSSGLEWPRVWVGEGAVHRVCAGEGGSRVAVALLASWITDGGDDGGGSETEEVRRARSIQRAGVRRGSPKHKVSRCWTRRVSRQRVRAGTRAPRRAVTATAAVTRWNYVDKRKDA
jgi:hypothetical protein